MDQTLFSQVYMIYIMFMTAVIVILGMKHLYLVHVKLNRYMTKYHRSEWNMLKSDTSLYRLPWMNIYYTKAVYDFIWRSNESMDDTNVILQKQKIRRFMLELSAYFVMVIGATVVAVLVVFFGILK